MRGISQVLPVLLRATDRQGRSNFFKELEDDASQLNRLTST
jgi:hypothetical protein